MPRMPRKLLPDGTYHVTSRGNGGQRIVLDDEDRRTWIETFGQVTLRFGWIVHAYCLLDNHFHIVVATTIENLSRAMQRLNGDYAQGFNRRHGRTGHLFQGRYHAKVIESDEYLEEACRYVVLNPVRAGLCAGEGDWPWARFVSSGHEGDCP
jgi:putative transposase